MKEDYLYHIPAVWINWQDYWKEVYYYYVDISLRVNQLCLYVKVIST